MTQGTSGPSDVSWCRHCGMWDELTREHIPPFSTGNTGNVRRIDESLDVDAVLGDIREWPDGHTVRTLCDECNNRASRWKYVEQYGRWRDVFVDAHTEGRRSRVDPFRGSEPFPIELPYDLMPGRFFRQAIGMLLAVQQSVWLVAEHPVLPELIGPDPADSKPGRAPRARHDGMSIAPLCVYMSVFSGSWRYTTMPMMQISVPLGPSRLIAPPGSRSTASELLVLALAPFVFVATRDDSRRLGVRIDEWAEWDLHQRGRGRLRLDVPTVDMMEMPLPALLYPSDYT